MQLNKRIMKSIIIRFSIILTVFVLICSCTNKIINGDIIISNITIVDVENLELHPNQTIVVEGNKITDISPYSRRNSLHANIVIDGSNKYVMPGLWDMHAHATFPYMIETFYPAFVANGVTGIRDMWGISETARKAKMEIAEGKLIGPRIVVAGNMVDGPTPLFDGSVSISTTAEATDAVDSLQNAGADFIKVQSGLSREVYFAIIEKAKHEGVVVAGHVPYSVSVSEVSDAGQKSIEHLNGVLEGCSPDEMTIKNSLHNLSILPDNEKRRSLQKKLLESFSEERFHTLAQRFVKNETWQVPTLIVLKAYSFPDEWRLVTKDPKINIIPSMMRPSWEIDNNSFVNTRSQTDWEMQQQIFKKKLELVNLLNQEGVKILAGTDTPNPTVLPGYSLHDELALLVEAGLTPMEALQTATINPAKYLNATDSIGTVTVNKMADLIVLTKNPFENIKNTQTIDVVLCNGRYYNRKHLDDILKEIEKNNDKE